MRVSSKSNTNENFLGEGSFKYGGLILFSFNSILLEDDSIPATLAFWLITLIIFDLKKCNNLSSDILFMLSNKFSKSFFNEFSISIMLRNN